MGIYSKLKLTEDTLKHLQILWDYLKLNQSLTKSDLLLVAGSHDLRIADKAVELFKEGYAPLILFSGGFGTITKDLWKEPEAVVLSNIVIKNGVPKESILIEDKAKNTGENITLSYELLKRDRELPKTIILLTKPFMERRFYATFKKQWLSQETKVIVTSPNIPMKEYILNSPNPDRTVNQIVLEAKKIIDYPSKGFQIEQEMPKEVLHSMNYLLENGLGVAV